MSKILNDLDKIQTKRGIQFNENNSLNESMKLLSAPQEDLSILHKIGLDHKLNLDRRKISEIKTIEHYKKTIGDTYSGNDIKDMCYKYDLYLNRAVDFKSSINSEVTKEIKNFCVKNDIIPVYNSFYVLAPSEYFKKELDVTENCILFYKDSNNNFSNPREIDKFTKIASWGGNQSKFRSFRFLFKNDSEYEVPTIVITWVSIGFFIISFICNLFEESLAFGIFLSFFASIMLLINGFIRNENLWN